AGEEPIAAEEQPIAAEPEPELALAAAAPAAVADEPVAQTPAEADAETDLPEGFDLSRFGPHVQAAYRGPTPENPSLSLRHRLSRAAALDQAERRATEEGGADAAPAAATE